MHRYLMLSLLALCGTLALPAVAQPQTETLVLFRHGEKPAGDLGQLTCQGLNRALALPARLQSLFGQPDYLFAPNPAATNHGFSYVRPLATIEPTAIRLGMPVNTQFAYDNVDGLLNELTQPRYRHAMIWLAWEHGMIEQLLKRAQQRYPSAAIAFDKWPKKDFDSLVVLTLTWEGQQATLGYQHLQQHLDGQSASCPMPAAASAAR